MEMANIPVFLWRALPDPGVTYAEISLEFVDKSGNRVLIAVYFRKIEVELSKYIP